MKKILVLTLAVTLAFTSMASAAATTFVWASGEVTLTTTLEKSTDTKGVMLGSTVFKPSTNVDVTAIGNTTEYSVSTGHVNGDKSYSSTSASPELTEGDKVKGAALGDAILPLPSEEVAPG